MLLIVMIHYLYVKFCIVTELRYIIIANTSTIRIKGKNDSDHEIIYKQKNRISKPCNINKHSLNWKNWKSTDNVMNPKILNYSLNMDISNQTGIAHILKIISVVYICQYTSKPQIIYGLEMDELR